MCAEAYRPQGYAPKVHGRSAQGKLASAALGWGAPIQYCTLKACGLPTPAQPITLVIFDFIGVEQFSEIRPGTPGMAAVFPNGGNVLAARFQRAIDNDIPPPGRRSLRSLALGCPALHLRCERAYPGLHLRCERPYPGTAPSVRTWHPRV